MSLSGHLKLKNLIVFFDNNKISIYGPTNLTISDNYKESHYSYKLCANADLVIAKHTSIADECLASEIPVIFRFLRF